MNHTILDKLDRIEKLLIERNDEILDFNETAKFLRISRSHLYKLTSQNKIKFYRPGGKLIYFRKAELKNWLLRNPVKTSSEIDQEATDYLVK